MKSFFAKKSYRKAVFIVVYKIEDKNIFYLILKRIKHWKGFEFPKGGIDDGEGEIDAVKRETLEETGLKIKKITNHKIMGKYKYPRGFPDRNGIIGQTYSLYSAEVYPGKVKIDTHEHDGYEWLSYSSAQKKISKQSQKMCIGIVNRRIVKLFTKF